MTAPRDRLSASQDPSGTLVPPPAESASDRRTADRGWWWDAACAGTDPEVFFPETRRGVSHVQAAAVAKRVCAGCPVRDACLEEALARRLVGVLCGLTMSEREQLRRAA